MNINILISNRQIIKNTRSDYWFSTFLRKYFMRSCHKPILPCHWKSDFWTDWVVNPVIVIVVKYFVIILLKLRLRGNVEISFRSELSDLFSVAIYENKQTVRIGEARCRTTFFFFLCFQVAWILFATTGTQVWKLRSKQVENEKQITLKMKEE